MLDAFSWVFSVFLICVTLVLVTWITVHYSPFHTYVRGCVDQTNDFDYCVWLYYEIAKEESWLRQMLIKLSE